MELLAALLGKPTNALRQSWLERARRYPPHQSKPDIGPVPNAAVRNHPLRRIGKLLPSVIRRKSGLLLPAPPKGSANRFKVREIAGETRYPRLPKSLLGQEINVGFQDSIPFLSSSPSCVFEVPQGGYQGHDHSLFDHDFRLLDWGAPYWALDCGLPATMFRGRLGNPHRLHGRALVLSAPAASGNLYHLLYDSLPKIKLLEMAGIDLQSFEHILVNSLQMPAAVEICARAGLPETRLVETDTKSFITADSLTLVSLGYLYSPDPWALHWLRCIFGAAVPAVRSSERIFLSRRDAASRRFQQESELFELLKPWGFRKVEFAVMSLAQQVETVRNAEAIVAPHGAALSNLVWARPGTKVVELFAAEFVSGCYWLIADVLDLDYYFAVGEPTLPRRVEGKAVLDAERGLADMHFGDVRTLARKILEALDAK